MEQKSKRKGFRVSLANLFLVLIICALALAWFDATKQRRAAQENLRFALDGRAMVEEDLTKFKTKAGFLHDYDESKTAVLRRNVMAANEWHWEVAIPQGAKYRLRYGFGKIPYCNTIPGSPSELEKIEFEIAGRDTLQPLQGATTPTFSISFRLAKIDGSQRGNLGSKEWDHALTSSIIQRHVDGVEASTLGGSLAMRGSGLEWFFGGGHVFSTVAGDGKVLEADPTKCIVLMSTRAAERDGEAVHPSQPSDGILIWLEPDPENASLPNSADTKQ